MSKKSFNTIIFNAFQRTVEAQTELRFSLTKTTNMKSNRGFAWEAVKYGWGKADEAVGNKGGSGAYHDIMSSSNHGGIR